MGIQQSPDGRDWEGPYGAKWRELSELEAGSCRHPGSRVGVRELFDLPGPS